jgi:hypothetical protein
VFQREDRVNIHNNARLTPIDRERIVMQVANELTPQAAARAAGVYPQMGGALCRRGRPSMRAAAARLRGSGIASVLKKLPRLRASA